MIILAGAIFVIFLLHLMLGIVLILRFENNLVEMDGKTALWLPQSQPLGNGCKNDRVRKALCICHSENLKK